MHLPHLRPFQRSPLYFFTACTVGRRPVLACSEATRILTDLWTSAAQKDGWFVGRYVVMPDHVHLFATPGGLAKSRAAWLKTWKSVSARQIAEQLRIDPPIWQPDTFDHILRNSSAYAKKWSYVRENPVRAGLTMDASLWPWTGEIHRLSFIAG
jgi:putative transposase